jgi:1-acyl-sn-glycerol-3-phosphate acyltransferase
LKTSQQHTAPNLGILNDIDPEFSEQIVKNVLSILNDVYFRISYIGFDEVIPRNNPDAPVILASNHSGRAIPWDAVCFMSGLLERFDYDYRKVCQTLIVPVLSSIGVMVPFFVSNFWKKCGGVDASFANFETLMQHADTNVMLYPEGVPGIGKGFNHKYELQQLSTSFIRMSLKYNTDIVPYSTVNAEYINPFMYNSPIINRLVKYLTGIPFLPLGLLTIVLLLQPWFYYFAFPAKITFVKGERIRREDLTDKGYDELSQEEIEHIRDDVHTQMQQELDEAVHEHGQRPYEWKEFFRTAWAKRKFFPYYLPPFWTFLFSEFQVQWEKSNKVDIQYNFWTMLKLFWKRPIVIAYFIPVIGWLPILYWSYLGKHKEVNVREKE